MALKLTQVTEEEARRITVFERWLTTEAPLVVLTCIIIGHVFPGPGDPDIHHELLPAGSHGRRQGTILLEAPCRREVDGQHCGTTIRKMLGRGGLINASRPRYDYAYWYHVPSEALEHGWLSREQRGRIREYIYVELPELSRAEARRRADKRRRAAEHRRKEAARDAQGAQQVTRSRVTA